MGDSLGNSDEKRVNILEAAINKEDAFYEMVFVREKYGEKNEDEN